MKRVLKSQNFWALLILLLTIVVVPYALCWFWYSPKAARATIYAIRIWCIAIVIMTGVACRIKIFAKEKMGLLNNKSLETFFDLLLSIPAVVSGVITIVSFLPMLIVSNLLAGISQKKHADKKDLLKISLTLSFVVVMLVFNHNEIVQGLVLFVFFTVVLKIVLYLLINFVAFVKDDDLFVDRIIASLYYVLCSAVSFVIGAPIEIHGTLPENGFEAFYSNHGGFVEYFLVMLVARFRPMRVTAGSNLLKYPIFADFIETVCVITDRKEGNRRKQQDVIADLVLSKKTPDEKTKNVKQVRTIARLVSRGIIIWLFPDGRDRLSKVRQGVFKKHACATAAYVGTVVPVFFAGTLHYKPASSNEPWVKKLGWRFQRWFSFRTIHVYYLDPVTKLPGETKEEFTARIDTILADFGKTLAFEAL